MQETLKRQQEGLGSSLELELNNRLAQLGDLRNKSTKVDFNNGNFIIGQLDENGLFDPSSIMDLRSIGKPGNILDNKVDLDTIVDEKTKNLSTWIIEEGSVTTEDPLQNEYVKKSIYDLTGAILNNPRAITSVLTDNTDIDYDFYYSSKDLDNKLKDRVAKQNEYNKQFGKPALSGDALDNFIESEKDKFILLSQDDQSVYQPNLTDKQIQKAKEVTLNRIYSRLDKKVTQDEPYRGGVGGGGSKPKEEKPTSGIPGIVYNAWDNVESLGAAESQRIMNQASGGKYSFKWQRENGVGGINVYKRNSRGELEKQNETPITNPKYLSDYFGYNPDKWTSEGKKGLSVKIYTSAQEANIKATLKDNPGATRQQVIKALGYE